jgi:hypothetical protein
LKSSNAYGNRRQEETAVVEASGELRDIFKVLLSLLVILMPLDDVVDGFLGFEALKNLKVLISDLLTLLFPLLIVERAMYRRVSR